MRVTNDRKYASTKAVIERFRRQVEAASSSAPEPGVHPRIHTAMIDGLRSEIRALEADVAEYERIKSGADRFAVGSLAELPSVLIKARIARNWTQRELAQRLDLAEQQIQRYEANRYAGVAFDRMREIARVLGVQVTGEARLHEPDAIEASIEAWRPAAVAMLLDAVRRRTGKSLRGRTRLQKLLVLWSDVLGQELGRPIFAPAAGDFGSFDQEVNDDVDFLSSGGLVQVGEGVQPPQPEGSPLQRAIRHVRSVERNEKYELTKDGLSWLDRFLKSEALAPVEEKERLRKLVEALAEEYGQLPLDRLIEETYVKLPELAARSAIREKVMARIRKRVHP